MTSISIAQALRAIPKEYTAHADLVQRLFDLLPAPYKRTVANSYGTQRNVLTREVRKKDDTRERVQFKFDGNRLVNPHLSFSRYNNHDISIVHALGAYVFGSGTYGNFVDDPKLDDITRVRDVEDLKKRNFLPDIDSDCCLAIRSQAAKAKKTTLPDGTELNSDWSVFYFSPLSAARGSTAYFHRSKSSFADLSDRVGFFSTDKVRVYNSEDLRLVGCKNISEVSGCKNTDLVETSDHPLFKGLHGKTVEGGRVLPWYVSFYRAVTGTRRTSKLVDQFFQSSKPALQPTASPAATATQQTQPV